MRAARLVAPRTIRIEEGAPPTPGPGELLVRLEGCGVCASNLPVWEGREWFNYPMEPGAPGHEGWGHVEALGPGVEGVEPGQRVAMLSGHAYATHDIARADEVVALPPELDGLPFPGEPLGCAMNIFERSEVCAGQSVAIIGIGFLGALLVRLAAQAGARVIAISRRPYALEVARQMGAHELVPLGENWAAIERVKALTGDALCERVIEATGKQGPLDLAAELAAERGRLVIAGYHQDGLRHINMQLWNWRALDVVNAHERDPRRNVAGMRAAVAAVHDGLLAPSLLLTPFRLDGLDEALRATHERPEGFLKAYISLAEGADSAR